MSIHIDGDKIRVTGPLAIIAAPLLFAYWLTLVAIGVVLFTLAGCVGLIATPFIALARLGHRLGLRSARP